MANNERSWNRNQEGSFQDGNDNDNRYRNRRSEYDNDFDDRRNESRYGSQGSSYGNYDRGASGFGDSRRSFGYNDERNMGDSDYGGYRGRFQGSQGSSQYYGGNYNDWTRGYSGPGNRNYDDRSNQGRNQSNDRDWWDRTTDEVSSWFGDEDAARRRRMDEMQGSHKGKGPKGYTRSDDRIKEDVNDRLSDDPYVDASDINATVSNCEVTLTGTVNSRREKRRAEDVAEAVSGVKNVENRLKVSSSSSSGTSSTSGNGNGNIASSGTGTTGRSEYNTNSGSNFGTSDSRKK
ncbi:MAG: uncharacterized protein JWP81_5180 [Ferruginibacter sp.]|nr:uncharacterized protein [Ferruginibacter sp.]